MFTGLVETQATVDEVINKDPAVRLVIRSAEISAQAEIGASIAVNGCCLTMVEQEADCLAFDAGEETLKRTNLQYLQAGAMVNLESSLKVGDALGDIMSQVILMTWAICTNALITRTGHWPGSALQVA